MQKINQLNKYHTNIEKQKNSPNFISLNENEKLKATNINEEYFGITEIYVIGYVKVT
jgi:hypothetical protein